jgi:FixJ family two-component response regulator
MARWATIGDWRPNSQDRPGPVKHAEAVLAAYDVAASPRVRRLALVEWAYEFVVAGLLNKQTAAELGNSEITIQVHRGQIMRKMGASSLADLVKMAGKLGIS